MMMTVVSLKRFDGHREVAGSVPLADAPLHQPGRAGVTEHVRGDIGEPGSTAGRGEAALNMSDASAAFVDHEPKLASA